MSDRGSPLLLRYYRRVEYEIGASYTPVCTHHICISAVWTRERFGFARRYMITICTEATRIDQQPVCLASLETVYRTGIKQNTAAIVARNKEISISVEN